VVTTPVDLEDLVDTACQLVKKELGSKFFSAARRRYRWPHFARSVRPLPPVQSAGSRNPVDRRG
jgi:hypothetical protein